MKKLILLLAGLLPLGLIANTDENTGFVVSFDRVEMPEEKVAFVADWKDLKPDLSDFKISYCRFLSNERGERFALVTFVREKGGLRRLKEDYVVGVLANGERLNPIKLEGETQLGERGSVLLHFGARKFPLVGLETRTD